MIKVINRMVLNRIQPILDLLLQSNQNGFRPGRSTTAQILTLRRIIEATRNLPAVIKSEKPLILSTGERCFRFSRPMASPHSWWTPLVKPTGKHGLMSSPLIVRILQNNHRRATRRHTSPLLAHNTSRLCTTRGYQGSWGESWTNHQA